MLITILNETDQKQCIKLLSCLDKKNIEYVWYKHVMLIK